jgi:hypothetical protein
MAPNRLTQMIQRSMTRPTVKTLSPPESRGRDRAASLPVHGRQACFGNQNPLQRRSPLARDGVCDTDTTAVIVWREPDMSIRTHFHATWFR